MQRDILFRGQRVDNGEWVYGGYFTHTPDENGLQHLIFEFVGGAIEVDPNTVGQFTGLLDRNQNKIFEGDVINIKIGNLKWEGVVMFNNGAFYIQYSDDTESEFNTLCSQDLEIIGNVHEKK